MSQHINNNRPYQSRRLGIASEEQVQTCPRKRERQPRMERIWFQGESSSSPQQLLFDTDSTPEIVRRTRRRTTRARPDPNSYDAMSQVPSSAMTLKPPTICEKCQATKFEFESNGFCCSDGEVRIASNEFPLDLLHLYTGRDEECLNFQTFNRFYNNFLAFSSLGGSFDSKTVRGIYVFKSHGQIYHYLPNLIPQEECPKYLQLYFYDSQQEYNIRANLFENLLPSVIATLMKIMEQNPYAKFFRTVGEKGIDQETVIQINKNAVLDQRVYNAPATDEVAAIWSDRSASSSTTGPYIVLTSKMGETHRIQHYYGCYDPLQYPLLFPYGDSGWRPGIPKISKDQTTVPTLVPAVIQAATVENLLHSEETSSRQRKKTTKDVSCREYYAYMLQIRQGNHILRTGRLFLQFIVDMYVKLENTRLDFFRNNQTTIRADLYEGLLDSVDMGQVEGRNAGHRIILPPSFIGGPRDMRRRYLNAMALVQKFGKPDIFATMTCNPNWPEIKGELGLNEKVQNRPDLVARIFRAKLLAAKKEIFTNNFFGEVAVFIYVVEFQKRGLPHAHFLIILKSSSKIKSPENFDRFVSAEIPSVDIPHLRSMVVNHMIHGPCGESNPSSPCMKNENGTTRCKSRYPKEFSEYTSNNDDGYPVYRRQNTGETILIRGHELDNRWVTPYNPYLLATFDCHFNVEICSTVQAVKYLYKYVYKGHDRVSFNIGNSDNNNTVAIDEIGRYQTGRWVSPPEAAWRIFGFDLFEMIPPVMPLHVHCEKKQLMHFAPHENLDIVVSDLKRAQTPLTEFFKMNTQQPQGPRLLYVELPQHYTWDSRKRTWKIRKKGTMVGRLAFVGPNEPKRFFLRMLLANVYAPKSYTDLRTVGPSICETYQEACIKRNLVPEDNTADLCLQEAVQMQMPKALRQLFVSLLIFCRPPNPKELWDKYFISLSEDFQHKYPHSEDLTLAHTAEQIEILLENMGKDLSEFGLGHLKNLQVHEIQLTRDVRDALETPIPEEYKLARDKLNVQQKQAYDVIINHVKQNIPKVFFIDGPGGTGKTYLYGALFAEVRMMNKIVLATASSGIAASCLPTGRTAHSRFKLPIDHDISLSCNVPKQGSLATLIRQATLIIWDEAPMANKSSIHALDLLLQDLCDCTSIFGGKIVVFGGDFRQVLPVVPHKTQKEAVEASLVCSYLWPHFSRFYLTQNMRAQEDPQFATFLLALGDGKLQQTEVANIALPEYIHNIQMPEVDPESILIQALTNSENDSAALTRTTYTDRAILTARNDEVDTINKAFIEKFTGQPHVYKSFDTLLDDNGNLYPTEFLNTLCPGGMSPHELILKQECPVMLLRNTDPANGLCNGTRLICRQFNTNTILCEIATGYYKGCKAIIHRIGLRPPTSAHYPFQFQRMQFPIKLCFAMTINKSQGQTLNQVVLYLRQPCFSHGQLYVALSRARCAAKVTVCTDAAANKTNNTIQVQNVISYEVLSKAGILQV